MACGVLFSAGKDSTLAALLLAEWTDVTLVTGTFGEVPVCETAQEVAAAVDLPFESLDLDPAVADAAVERMVADGFPRNGIQQVHEHAIERLAEATAFELVADGTRRDDRAPTVDRPLAQSIEDRYHVEYVAPLAGFGRGAVDRLVADHLDIETGPSDTIAKADYETELRALMAAEHGEAAVERVFPAHTQSRVRGRR
jgi:predicted subunit of tRNA(5-methylaminomethyl-2-thiouridylate) methyltransferase